MVVSHYGEGLCRDSFYNLAVSQMKGIAAVGLLGGEIILVDLGLDELRNFIQTPEYQYQQSTQEELTFELIQVRVDEIDLAGKRRACLQRQRLIFIDFSSKVIRNISAF